MGKWGWDAVDKIPDDLDVFPIWDTAGLCAAFREWASLNGSKVIAAPAKGVEGVWLG